MTRHPWARAAFAAVAAFALLAPAAAHASAAEDRFAITELMDRYGVVHDFGTPEEYADLFTPDGGISINGGPTVVKGRDALIAMAKRDHEKYVAPTGPEGEMQFFMRHLVTNRMVTMSGEASATGSCYVLTLINDGANGPVMLSFGQYRDTYVKQDGKWLIAHRDIAIDFGNQELGKRLGFR